MVKISDMIERDGVKIGSKLEIVMFQDVEFDNGHSHTMDCRPEGFSKIPESSDKPGKGIIGYVSEIEKNRIHLVPTQLEGNLQGNKYFLGRWYVEEVAICSYKKYD